jgi:hypothetical protein
MSSEIPEIIIASKTPKVRDFDLTRFRTKLSAFLDCNDLLGVYIPQKISNYLSIQQIEIPIIDKTAGSPWDMKFFVLLQLKSGDTLIELKDIKIQNKKNELACSTSQVVNVSESVNGFYVFMKYICSNDTLHGNILFAYTQNFKSKLTYRYLENKIILKDIKTSYQVPPGTQFDKLKFLNWKVKVEYQAD